MDKACPFGSSNTFICSSCENFFDKSIIMFRDLTS